MIKALTAAVLLLAIQDAKEENKEYKGWAGCKAGSWVAYAMEMEQGGMAMAMEMKKTLKSIDDKEAVLELKVTMNMQGRTMEMPGQEEKLPAKGGGRVKPVTGAKEPTEGDEEIEVGGKKLKCHWVRCECDFEKFHGVAKIWFTEEVPGGLAKLESTIDASADKKPGFKMTAKAWEKK